MPIEETRTEDSFTGDTVASGSHRLVLHVGAGLLAVMTLVGVSPWGSAIFGR